MDYADLLDGLVPDLEQAADDLEPNADLPAELVLVEDGEPQPEAIARLDYLRDYAVMVYGNAVVELVERDDEGDPENVVVRFLDPVDVTISVEENETEVRESGEQVEDAFLDTHSGEQDHYGTTVVDRDVETVEDAQDHGANLLDDLELTDIALAEEGYENSTLGPVSDEEDHGEQ